MLEFTVARGKLVGRKKATIDFWGKWRGRGRLPKALNVDMYLEVARQARSR